MKVDLSDVTLCAADSANLQLTARAMHTSMERCKFAEAVLFSHEPVGGDFRTVTTPNFDRAGYQSFRLKPPPTVETPFALFIEWDGYVLEPRAWHESFREYDYIGARWPGPALGLPGRTVGNSGFCLQSKNYTKHSLTRASCRRSKIMSICWFVENIVQSLSRNLTFGLRPSKSPTDFPMNCCFL